MIHLCSSKLTSRFLSMEARTSPKLQKENMKLKAAAGPGVQRTTSVRTLFQRPFALHFTLRLLGFTSTQSRV